MTISFVSIQENSVSEWEVVKKTFSNASKDFSTTKITLNHSCENQKTAEIAAKNIAKGNCLPYVPNNLNVITVAKLIGGYFSIELTSSGKVIFLGQYWETMQAALPEAQEVAQIKQLPFLTPKI
ncbi:Uncharacterized protein PHSC3_000002 [Chlamydiales bacterium STE3]|nr:Uncharacterized protein PHSC3_000002 [Chlamydiales bacterium STE3]